MFNKKNKKKWRIKRLLLARLQKWTTILRRRLILALYLMGLTKTLPTLLNTNLSTQDMEEGRLCGQERSQKISNLISIMILWVVLLGLSTHIFPDPYRDNAFYLLMFGYVTFVSVCVGLFAFRDKKTISYKFLRAVTFMNAAYFGLAVIGEVVNFWMPYFTINDMFDNEIGYRAAFCFEVGILWAIYVERKRLKQ